MDKVRHPNIISIMAVAIDTTHCYIVVEYFVSNTLRRLLFNDMIKSKQKITESNKNFIAVQICKAITFLHTRSPPVIHKDLKPENILVNEYFAIKICDLGLSRFSDMTSELETTVGQNFRGTLLYMSPEILIHNQSASLSADIWALGCVLFDLYSELNVWTGFAGYFDLIERLKSIIATQKNQIFQKYQMHCSL